MTVLDTLNFVAFNPLQNNNPIAVRRRKLVAKIDEQIQLATNKDYTPTQHKWVTDDDGKQTKVQVAKRVKRWWTASVDGKINLVVRYGSKPLEFAEGKNAIELASEAEEADTLRKVREAAELGELDALIEQQAQFGNSGTPLGFDDLAHLPSDQVEYWMSKRSPRTASAITIPAFIDPRIEAVQKQIREAETAQAIARLRLVWAEYQKRVFLLSNLPVEMPVDHLIEFNDLMPDRLEMELIRKGNLPLTPLGLEKMRPDLELSKEASKKLVQRSKASDPKWILTQLPELIRTTVQIATFKAGDKRKTIHHHLFLPKDYSGSPTSSIYTPWTDKEAKAYLTSGWGEGAITELKLEYLYGPEPEVSGE